MGRVLEVISILEKYPITREALESCYSSTFRLSTWDMFLKLSPYWRNIPSQEKLLSHAILLFSGCQHGTSHVLEVISILEKYPVTREALESGYSTFRWSTWDVFLKLSPYWRNIPSQEKLLSHAILLSGCQHGTCS